MLQRPVAEDIIETAYDFEMECGFCFMQIRHYLHLEVPENFKRMAEEMHFGTENGIWWQILILKIAGNLIKSRQRICGSVCGAIIIWGIMSAETFYRSNLTSNYTTKISL